MPGRDLKAGSTIASSAVPSGNAGTLVSALRGLRAGAIATGASGAVVGLIVGLHVYAATAVFAALEIGLPAALVGGLLGFVLGGLVAVVGSMPHRPHSWIQRIRRSRALVSRGGGKQ
jgi:hypothetical protein